MEMDGLNFIFYLLYLFGAWIPDSVKTKKAKFIYSFYRYLIAVLNAITIICGMVFIANSVISDGPRLDYNDTLFLIAGTVMCLLKYFNMVIFMKEKIKILEDLFKQNSFQPNEKSESNVDENYKKLIKSVIIYW